MIENWDDRYAKKGEEAQRGSNTHVDFRIRKELHKIGTVRLCHVKTGSDMGSNLLAFGGRNDDLPKAFLGCATKHSPSAVTLWCGGG